MTVAAVILAASPESALGEVDGLPRVRRLADVAWSGGAVPVIVVAPDPVGGVAAALQGASATLVSPAPLATGPVGQIVRGIDAATSAVAEGDGAIVWPARFHWVDAETITSLIEAHGQRPDAVLRPVFGGAAGWPVLVPRTATERLRALGADRMPEGLIDDLVAAGAPEWRLDLGDPGSTHDASVARGDLPAYLGPSGPASGHHEWGAAEAADAAAPADGPPDPLAGPGLAPFGQAAESEDPAVQSDRNALADDLARLEP
jgi:CTP:molybdopterin cytidylyltransferase MocA